MADTNILSDFGINILEEEIDDLLHHCSSRNGLQDDGET